MKFHSLITSQEHSRKFQLFWIILTLTGLLLFQNIDVHAQFTIGVWQPGGYETADISFSTSDINDLNNLGINLLINTPRLENVWLPTIVQDFEESIMEQWNNSGIENSSFVVYYEPENVSPGGWTLEHYAGNLGTINQIVLNSKVFNLVGKWGNPPYLGVFYGYRIGH